MLLMAPSLLMVSGKATASFNITAGTDGTDEGWATASAFATNGPYGTFNSGDSTYDGADIYGLYWQGGFNIVEVNNIGSGELTTVTFDGIDYAASFLQSGAYLFGSGQLVFDGNTYDVILTG